MGTQVGKENYTASYDTKERFVSYWHQIHQVISLNPDNVLEIGIGTGFTSRYLIERNIRIITLDYSSELKPDVVGSVLNIPFKKNSFDVLSSFQVLEHLPFRNFKDSLIEFGRVTKSYVVISLPDAGRVYRLFFHIPMVGLIKKVISAPNFICKDHKFDGQHYWEINKKGYELDKVIKVIEESGYWIINTFRVFENTYHRFFILKKIIVK